MHVLNGQNRPPTQKELEEHARLQAIAGKRQFCLNLAASLVQELATCEWAARSGPEAIVTRAEAQCAAFMRALADGRFDPERLEGEPRG